MTSASDIMRFLRRFGASGDEGRAFFAISTSNSLQKSSAIQKISVTLLSVIMIQYLLFGISKLLNINDITKRIVNFFKLPIQLFRVSLIPNSRQLEIDIENGAGNVSELRRRIASLEAQLETTGHKLTDKCDKLKTADRQLTELQDELDVLTEKRDTAQKNFHEFTEKNQEQVRMRLTDAVFGRLIVDIRELFAAMPSEVKADLDGEFLTAISEQPNEILKCAMYLFLGYLDGATQFAQSFGGGGSDSSLPWGCKEDEDDRRFAYRCMMQAHKMLKPSQPKQSMNGRR